MNNRAYTRREFIRSGVGLLAGAAVPGALATQAGEAFARPNAETPNLIYIMADQLRACSVGSYGNWEISTPNIDRLATEGACFSNAVSTSPLCSPHRACLMTGRYPSVTGVTANCVKLPREEVGIAQVFRASNYQTGYIGKWHLDGPTGILPDDPGWVAPADRQGFGQWLAFNRGHMYYEGKYYANGDPTLRHVPDSVYEPDFQTQCAISFINANRARRFCLFLSIGTPHNGYRYDLPPGGDYLYPYDPAGLTLRPNVDWADLDLARQEYADYYGTVGNFDWNVGRILELLDRLNLADSTVVVVSSDHGDFLGSHSGLRRTFRGKDRIHAESLDIPFILRYPNQVAPAVLPEVFTSVDQMPTLLGLCGLNAPQGVMGRDFSPALTDGGQPVDPPWGPVPSTDSAVVGFRPDWVGLRSDTCTLECSAESLKPQLLFDNVEDPYQMTNVVDDPAYAGVKDALHEELLAWLDYTQY